MDRFTEERAQAILRDALDAVKKHYYDPKFHGIDLDARYKQYDEKIQGAQSLSQALGVVAGFLDGLRIRTRSCSHRAGLSAWTMAIGCR